LRAQFWEGQGFLSASNMLGFGEAIDANTDRGFLNTHGLLT
jgi:hypothetical protein